MGLRSLVLSTVVGFAALGASAYSPAAQARGYVSVSIGTPSPYYGNQYGGRYDNRYGSNYGGHYDNRYRNGHGGGHHRPGVVLVPAHWVSTYQGRVWVPAQYVQARGGYDRGGYGYGPRPVYRQVPRGFDPRYGYDPRYGRDRGW